MILCEIITSTKQFIMDLLFNTEYTDPSIVVLGGTVVGAAALVYFMTRKDDTQIDSLYDFEKQSIEIDPIEHVRVNSVYKDKPLVEYRMSDVLTLADVLRKGLEVSGDGPCLGTRENKGKGPYSWISYSEVIKRVGFIGSGLINKGVQSGNSTRIGIYSTNRAEWIISEHACYNFSLQVVSLYDSYGKESIKYITNHAEIQAIFVDTFERLSNILVNISETPSLKFIIHYDDIDAKKLNELKIDIVLKAVNNEQSDMSTLFDNIQIIHYIDLMKSGQENPVTPILPKPSDAATICYTSGTTGVPKGAIISHLGIISCEAAVYNAVVKEHLGYTQQKAVHLSFLPLSHMFERQVACMHFLNGSQYGLFNGDIKLLVDDIKELKPTYLPLVPRLLNRFYGQVMGQVKGSPIKMALMKRALAAKEQDRKRGIYRNNTIWDKLVFNKVRAAFGGRIDHLVTGSAPVSDEVLNFNKAIFGCPIPEGYGQTEFTTLITATHPFDPSTGHVGPPSSNAKVKLVSVPEMGYFADVDQGEICAKGPSMFLGYLKDEEKTKETIDKDGWLHTGDIGMWLPNGCLKVIDRKKHLFKLAQGEYISPEKVEAVYNKCSFVAQIIVEGNPLKDFTVGILVPDPVYFQDVCKKMNLTGSMEELCNNKQICKVILEDLTKIGKESGLMSYEQVRMIHLHPEMFSVDNGLATATMKVKRLTVREKFKDSITQMYQEYDESK